MRVKLIPMASGADACQFHVAHTNVLQLPEVGGPEVKVRTVVAPQREPGVGHFAAKSGSGLRGHFRPDLIAAWPNGWPNASNERFRD